MYSLTDVENAEGLDCGSCGADYGPSASYPWHYPDEDCRAVRPPVQETEA
jgi:hypothetical protein